MTINGKAYTSKNVKIENIDSKALNVSMNGGVYGYFFGEHKEISFSVEWLSLQERVNLEEARKEKVLMVLDTGEEYNVRIELAAFEEKWIAGECLYNTTIKAIEVVS